MKLRFSRSKLFLLITFGCPEHIFKNNILVLKFVEFFPSLAYSPYFEKKINKTTLMLSPLCLCISPSLSTFEWLNQMKIGTSRYLSPSQRRIS
jgi:hypothetical protein